MCLLKSIIVNLSHEGDKRFKQCKGHGHIYSQSKGRGSQIFGGLRPRSPVNSPLCSPGAKAVVALLCRAQKSYIPYWSCNNGKGNKKNASVLITSISVARRAYQIDFSNEQFWTNLHGLSSSVWRQSCGAENTIKSKYKCHTMIELRSILQTSP